MESLMHIVSLTFLIYMTLNHIGEAGRIIAVGGSLDGWKVPEPSNNTLNHWAESVRFQVGDTLVFYYDIKKDSVLQVTKENYESCNTQNPLKEYKGETKVKLDVSGPYYFISGAQTGNCGKGEKLIVVVRSPNHSPVPKPGPGPVSTPPPTPSSPTVPAPAPAKNSAVGMVFGNGLLLTFVAIIGLVWG